MVSPGLYWAYRWAVFRRVGTADTACSFRSGVTGTKPPGPPQWEGDTVSHGVPPNVVPVPFLRRGLPGSSVAVLVPALRSEATSARAESPPAPPAARCSAAPRRRPEWLRPGWSAD